MPHPDVNMFGTDGHPDEGLLHEWLDEQLSVADSAMVAAHVAECAECQARVAEARGLIAASRRILTALDDVPANVIPSEKMATTVSSAMGTNSKIPLDNTAAGQTAPAEILRPRPWRRWSQIAAVLVIAVMGTYVSRTMNRNQAVSSTTTTNDSAAPTPPVPTLSAPANVGDSSVNSNVNRTAIAALATKTAKKLDAPAHNAQPMIAQWKALPTSPPVALHEQRRVRDSSAAAPPIVARVPTPPLVQRMSVGEMAATSIISGSTVASVDASAKISDTLAQRLELERRQRAATEAVAADTLKRTRIEPLGSTRLIAPPPTVAGSGVSFGNFAPPIRVSFDNLVLTHAPCTERCNGYEIQVNNTGNARYVSYSTNREPRTLPVQLSTDALRQLDRMVANAFGNAPGQALGGETICTALDRHNVPTLRLSVTRSLAGRVSTTSIISSEADPPTNNVSGASAKKAPALSLRDNKNCSVNARNLFKLSGQVDSIIGVEKLSQKVPPEH